MNSDVYIQDSLSNTESAITLLHKVSVHHISGVYVKNQYDQTTDLSPIFENLLKE